MSVIKELEDKGYDVYEACYDRKDIEMTLMVEPDLVLFDINIPHKTGFELLKEIREKQQMFAARLFLPCPIGNRL